MSPAEWKDRMDKCTSREEMVNLLKHKPKGTSAVRTGMTVLVSGSVDSPLFDKLNRPTRVGR